jgi:Na+/proline symporter
VMVVVLSATLTACPVISLANTSKLRVTFGGLYWRRRGLKVNVMGMSISLFSVITPKLIVAGFTMIGVFIADVTLTLPHPVDRRRSLDP